MTQGVAAEALRGEEKKPWRGMYCGSRPIASRVGLVWFGLAAQRSLFLSLSRAAVAGRTVSKAFEHDTGAIKMPGLGKGMCTFFHWDVAGLRSLVWPSKMRSGDTVSLVCGHCPTEPRTRTGILLLTSLPHPFFGYFPGCCRWDGVDANECPPARTTHTETARQSPPPQKQVSSGC